MKVSFAELKQQTVTKLQKLVKPFASLVKIDNARESSLRKLIQMVEARQDWTRRDSKQVAHALASSAKSMNARLALVARDFVGLVDEAVDAFVDFFVFMLLSETVSLKDARSGLNLFRKFSRSLTNKAKQYRKMIPARPTVSLRRYTALLAAQKSLAATLRGFAHGLETGANVMLEGERVVRLFLSRKLKSKTIEL